MNFFRLIKPDWGKPSLANGEANPSFIKEVKGPDTYEGSDYAQDFIDEKNKEGYNVYFFPNHPSTNVYEAGVKHLSGKHIDTFEYVFVDMDLKDKVYATKEEFITKVSEFPLKPTFVVDSGNGVHAYWQVSDLSRDLYVFMQLGLINHFKTDESVFTTLQLMRFPNSLNTKKYGQPVQAAIVDGVSSGAIYQSSDFPEFVFALPEEAQVRGQNHVNKLDGKLKINLPEFANLDELPDKFISFILDPVNELAYNLFYQPKQTHGDRSGADMKLANILFRANFNRKECLAVIANTEKALGKNHHRFQYAEMTVDKIYQEKLTSKFKTVGQFIRTNEHEKHLGDLVRGPHYMDSGVLGEPWRKKELMGLIAGTGVGKTSMTLEIMKDSIENNVDNDDVYIFFSLEMTEAQITKRWINLVGSSSPLADRLYVIGNYDEKNSPRNIGLQEIMEYTQEIKKLSGKNVGIMAIDHIGIVSKHIDTRKKYTFGIKSQTDAGWGDIRTLGLDAVASQMKALANMLDTYILVLTQTTKDKGAGDLPIGKDGAFGISAYENIMDRIVTLWQPLSKVQAMSKTSFMAWQYVKIREKHPDDKIKENEPKLMTYEIGSGDIRQTTPQEYEEFKTLLPAAIQAREDMVKKKGNLGYTINVPMDVINKHKASLGLVRN